MAMDTKSIATVSVLVVFLICSNLVQNSEAKSVRQKRTVFQLCTLINYYTNRPCTDFNDYGCFCGYGQQGRKPMDRTDSCCRKHDSCYGRVNCFMYPQFVSIGFECDDETRTCHCTDPRGTCKREVCECEISLAECLADAPYHNTYYHMDRSTCK